MLKNYRLFTKLYYSFKRCHYQARAAFRPCNVTGVIDSLTEAFPGAKPNFCSHTSMQYHNICNAVSSSGTKWILGTDTVMGGRSTADYSRAILGPDGSAERPCNILRGNLCPKNATKIELCNQALYQA